MQPKYKRRRRIVCSYRLITSRRRRSAPGRRLERLLARAAAPNRKQFFSGPRSLDRSPLFSRRTLAGERALYKRRLQQKRFKCGPRL